MLYVVAAVAGFAAGLAFDLLVVSTPVGLYALAYCLTGYAVGMVRGAVLRASRWIPMLAAVAGSAFGVALFAVRALRRRSPADRMLLALGLPLFAIFAAVSLLRRVEPNWPGPAYLPALVGLAAMNPSRRLLRAAAWTCARSRPAPWTAWR